MKEKNTSYYYGGNSEAVSHRIGIVDALKGKPYLDLMEVGVEKWRADAVKGARKMLGFVEDQSKSGRRRKKKERRKHKGKHEGLIAAHAPLKMDVDALQTGTDPDTDGEEVDEGMDVDVKPTATSFTGPENPSTVGTVQDHEAIPLEQPQAAKKWIPIPGKLDPEMRITSWFTCTKCHTLEPAYKRLKVLDFKGLCAHSCVQVDKKKRDRTKWSLSECSSPCMIRWVLTVS